MKNLQIPITQDEAAATLVDHVKLVKPTLAFSFYYDCSICFSGHSLLIPLRPAV